VDEIAENDERRQQAEDEWHVNTLLMRQSAITMEIATAVSWERHDPPVTSPSDRKSLRRFPASAR
jgi:hypothetical protein